MELERLVLLVDRMIVEENTEGVADASADLAELARSLSDNLLGNLDGAGKEELETALDKLRSALEDLARSFASLNQNGMPEFMNQEAFEESELGSLGAKLAEIQELIAQGKLDEAKEKLQELLDSVQKLANDFKDGASDMAQKADQEFYGSIQCR